MLKSRLLVITFIESFAAVMVQRGVYFFARDVLGFTDAANLSLALVFGGSYVVGALLSHSTCSAAGERRVLLGMLLGQVVVHATMAALPSAAMVYAGMVAIGALNGMKWPVLESYVSAGQTADVAARSVGRFNVTWSASVPLALVVAGPLLHFWPRAMFLVPAAANIATFILSLPLPPRPLHLPADHPQRPAAGELARMGSLLVSARWMLMLSYAAMWIMAALLPGIMSRLGFAVTYAAGLSSLADVVRLLTFAVLSVWTAWHGRAGLLLAAMVALPAGFFLVLLGQATAQVLLGLALFGVAAGIVYHAALYYAMVVKNASVGAGGGHEGLIGLGFALGPATGLAAMAMRPALGGEALAVLVGVGPLFAICLAASARYALRTGRGGQAE